MIEKPENDYFDIGNYHCAVTTKSQTAQKWINRGLMNLWGFNHYAATQCFKSAIQNDQKCCFAYWGIAYARGPHYNNLFVNSADFEEGLKYLELAENHKSKGQNWEQSLIQCLKYRYPKQFKEENQQFTMKQALILFNQQTKKIYDKFNTNLQIVAIYAESIMNLNPWQLWGKDGSTTPEAQKSKQVLQLALKQGFHPQIHHLYIHLMEMSPNFRVSLPISEQLEQKTRGISHLLHMPSHIYIQIGDYRRSLESNIKAVEADIQTKLYLNNVISFYEFYQAHNSHFAAWAAMFLGDYDQAIFYSKFTKDLLHEGVLDLIGNKAEFYVNVELHTLIRFGKWNQIINRPFQTRPQYQLYRVTQRYSRTLAYAVLGEVKQSEKELAMFYEELKLVNDRYYGNNTFKDIFAVAEAMARGEIQYRKGNFIEAFEQLRKSVKLCDLLVYDEPWDWMQPPRHALGALLLQQGHLQESEQVYQRDLQIYPNNIWSLTGLEEVYRKCQNNKKLLEVQKLLIKAQKQSKESIKASCFCKKN